MLPVIAAIAAAHEEGVVHRDLKPANLFLARTRDGATLPKVLDFGISHMAEGRRDGLRTRDNDLIGSPAYMAPEQTRGASEATARSDQYSLGVILYECAAGRCPFPGETVYAILTQVALGEHPSLRTVRPEVPAAFEAVVARAMSLDPAARYGTVRELGRALLPFAGERAKVLWGALFDPDHAETLSLNPPASRVEVIRPATRTSTLGSAAVSIAAPPEALPRPHAEGSARRATTAAVAAVLLAGCVSAGMILGRRIRATQQVASFEVSIESTPRDALITLDGREVGTGRLVRRLPRDGRPHTLVVTAPGYFPHDETFVNTPPASRITLRPTHVTRAAPTTPLRAATSVTPAPIPVRVVEPRARRVRRRPAAPDSSSPPVAYGANGTGIY